MKQIFHTERKKTDMKSYSKILFLIVAAAMIISMFSIVSSAASSGTTGKVSWSLDDNGTFTVSGKGEMADYSLSNPSPWDSYGSSIKSVVIGEGVTTVGAYAFAYCDAIESVTLPSTLTAIKQGAFFYCSGLEEVTIPAAVITIGASAFRNTGLKSITFKGEVIDNIASNAFSNVKGAYVNLPAKFTVNYPKAGSAAKPTAINYNNCSTYFGSKNLVFFEGSITVFWMDANGIILETDADVASGTTPEYNGKIPTSSSGVFAGWDPEVSAVTESTVYVAQYASAADDLDGDGDWDAEDYEVLRKYLEGSAELSDEQLAAADLDGDTQVDAFDLFRLAKMISNLDTQSGSGSTGSNFTGGKAALIGGSGFVLGAASALLGVGASRKKKEKDAA